MMTKNEYRGLCSTCEGRATCTYTHAKGQPVLFCEEFDGLCDNLTAAAGGDCRFLWGNDLRMSRGRSERRVEVRQKPSPYEGLCATCESQDTCAFPKPSGGVWHCEELS